MTYRPTNKDGLKQTSNGIRIELFTSRVQARFNGETLAESRSALFLYEAGYKPVLYFPREDVRVERLKRVFHQSYCPYKGKASCWSLRVGKGFVEDVAWSYEDPLQSIDAIKNHIAFNIDKIQIIQPPENTGEQS